MMVVSSKFPKSRKYKVLLLLQTPMKMEGHLCKVLFLKKIIKSTSFENTLLSLREFDRFVDLANNNMKQ